jgi:phosphopantetheinyl transferase
MRIATPWDDRVLVLRELSLDVFTPNELAIANAFKLASRREDWLLSRYAAKRLAMQFGLADDPRDITVERPFVVIRGTASDWRVSLSHSAPYAGAAMARAAIGLDVQLVRAFDERAAHLFLTSNETDQLERCALPHRLLHFWCAKEAAWKQRSEDFVTLRQVPLRLVDERIDGLRFDAVETRAIDELIVAVTLPTS